jgi:3-oxoacyl-[acyl-carrier protein] reductase
VKRGELTDLTAVVTGASRGIGRAIALRLAAGGAQVALLARHEKDFPKLRGALLLACDVSDAGRLQAAMESIDRRFGQVHLLINNAAFGGPFHDVESTDDAEWARYLDTNISAPFRLCRHYLPMMKKQSFGRIVNVSSVLGLAGAPQSAAYAATKHALIGLTRSLALEGAPFGVTVNALCPGLIATDMTRGRQEEAAASVPARRFGSPEEVAEFAAMLCRRDSGYINGAALTIDGALLAGLVSPE